MKVFQSLLGFLLLLSGSKGLIIPDELPSILSVIYSNIPTIKKGTDSRLGWGFRLGDRADFQVLVELGPQTNTKPLGNQDQPDAQTRKRNTLNTLSNELYALRQQEKKNKEQVSNTQGGKWLSQWSKDMAETQTVQTPISLPEISAEPKPGLGIGEIDAKSVIPEDSVLQLEELYEKIRKQNRKLSKTTESILTKIISSTTQRTTTSKKDALDNVSLDDDSN